MQVGDTVTVISVLLQSILKKKVISLKIANSQFRAQRFLSFRYKNSKKNIDILISKRQKPQGTRLPINLSQTPAYLLLWIPKLQHFSQRWNRQLVSHLNMAVIPAKWDGFLSCNQLLQSCTT